MTREAPLILSASCAGPDLLVPPHAFKGAFDVCVGAETPDPEWQEHLVAHLGGCTYCRTAVIFLLCVAQEADRRSDNEDGQAGRVLEQFAP